MARWLRTSTASTLARALVLLLVSPAIAGENRIAVPPHQPSGPALTAETKEKFREAADDPTLAPWQREFMRELVEGHHPKGAGTGHSPSAAPSSPADVDVEDGAWSQLPAPSENFGHTAIYDPVRDRMVVFGGSNFNDTWELSLAGTPAWTQL